MRPWKVEDMEKREKMGKECLKKLRNEELYMISTRRRPEECTRILGYLKRPSLSTSCITQPYHEDMLDVLEGGLRLIRNTHIILNRWSPNINVAKEDITTVPVWIKIHNVSFVGFADDGLSAMATKIGKSLLLDSY